MFNEFGEKEAVARIGGISDIVSTMDGVFTVSGALRFLVLQLVLVIPSFTSYPSQRSNDFHYINENILELLHPPVLECDEPSARQSPDTDRAEPGCRGGGRGGQHQQ